jgi:hypothetical protein
MLSFVPSVIAGLLLGCLTFLIQPSGLLAQTSRERYETAWKILEAHTPQNDFWHDGSPEAITALTAMRLVSQDAVVELLRNKPNSTDQDIEATLCQVRTSFLDCGKDDKPKAQVVNLGPQLFVIALRFDYESGAVFIVGSHGGKTSALWSINAAASQSLDSKGLLQAWRADRADEGCLDEHSGHLPGTCGPLYASVGALPSDVEGRPRFYINAGYAQLMGSTIASQSSVWRWDGDHATLLWIGLHEIMINQQHSVDFVDDILGFWEKEDFRTFYSCGSCEGKQVIERFRITPTSVDYLGKQTTQPELDLIDELFWRLAHGQPTSNIASPQVSSLLSAQIRRETRESQKIDKDFFSIGMFGDSFPTFFPGGEKFCFTADELGHLEFTIRPSSSGHNRLTSVSQPSGNFESCIPQPTADHQK